MSAEPMVRELCPVCEKIVEDYEPGVSSVLVGGSLYHPHCTPAADYLAEVIKVLTIGKEATRDQRPSCRGDDWPLSDDERDEAEDAFTNGVSAREFALRLANRDINAFERAYEQQQSDDCCRDFGAEFRDSQIAAMELKR